MTNLELETIVQSYTGFLSGIVAEMRRDRAQIRTVSHREICAAGLRPLYEPDLVRRVASTLSAATRQDEGPTLSFAAYDARQPELFHIVVSDVEWDARGRGH